MFLYGYEHVDEEGDELQVAHRVLARSEQQGAGIGSERPVVVLTTSVDACEGFLVEQEHEAVLAGYLLHEVHNHLVLVVRQVGLTIDRCKLELVGRYLVVAGLQRDAVTVAGYLDVLHELHHT